MSAAGKHSQPYPWEQVKLSKTSRSYSGGTPKVGVHEYYDGQIPFIRSGEIASKSTELTISETGLNNSSAKLVSKGDILYALYGATSGEVSLSKINGAINQAILAIKPIDGYENYFLMTWLQKEKEQITRTYLQGGQGNLSAKIVMNLVVNIPSLSEQSQIAQIFSKLDKTITLHEEKHRQLERLKKALLQKMFADETGYPALRFKGFTAKWEQRKLGDITRRYDNLRVPVTASKRKHGDIPYYGANGIQDFVSGYTHDGEFILVAEDGARDPKNYPVNYVNGKIWVNNHAHVLQGIQGLANNLFLLNGIKKINIVAYLVGGSRAKLNAETLMQLSIKLPSIHEQEKIGQLFQSLDKTITLHDKKIQYLKQLKRGLLQKMFV